MMKTTILHASLLVSLAPLALACVEPAPIDDPDTAAVAAAGDDEAVDTAESALKKPKKPRIFPRQSSPYGKSYEEWAVKWWQWSLPIAKDVNPMLGGACNVDQSGKVFFLAGTTGGQSERDCTIPKNKALFFPLVNAIFANQPEYVNGEYTCELAMSEENLHSCVEWYEGLDFELSMEVDGVAADDLEDYSVHTDTFTTGEPENEEDQVFPSCTGDIDANSCGVAAGTPRQAASGGYWIMLKPLSPGQHELHFTGAVSYEGGSFSVDVTYNLTVQH